MPSARRRISSRWRVVASRATVLAALALSAAGCVSMPDGGPPTPLTATQSGAAQNQDYTVLDANPPAPGELPKDIVQGFLLASLRYSDPAQQQVARDYLTPSASGNWHPQGDAVTVFTSQPDLTPAAEPKNAKRTTVSVSGSVVATLNGNGQQVLSVAQAQPQPAAGDACGGAEKSAGSACEQVTLVKYDGQWRIQVPPANLLIDQAHFDQVYQSQDVYFFDPGHSRLVPDTVWVPLGTSVTNLLTTLVRTLITGPSSTWLGNSATFSAFPSPPANITPRVTVESGTAVVNLSGDIPAASLPEIAAQLVWTLVGSSTAQYSITAVELEINQVPWEPNGSNTQTLSGYSGYNPYPADEASFTYVDGNHAAQSQCGSVNALAVPVPVFSVVNEPKITSCSSVSPASTPPVSPTPGHRAVPQTPNPLSMVAVSSSVASSSTTYVAGVSPSRNQVSIWQVGLKGAPVARWSGAGITSVSWDGQQNLWITTSSNGVWVLPSTNWREPIAVQDPFGGAVSALSIAPDGVRVAAIVNGELELAAITRNTSVGTGGREPSEEFVIGTPVPLGPSVTGAVAVTWYDKDNLMVIAASDSGRAVEEVPVNGQAATQVTTFPTPPAGVYAESIAADTSSNVLVVGLSSGQLEYSAGVNGTWRPLASGWAPDYVPNP
jgi:hypothetical protein